MTAVLIKQAIAMGQTFLGIELGSTRIKAVLIGSDHTPIAAGDHSWENRLDNGVWTYYLDDVWQGLQSCFRALSDAVLSTYGEPLNRVSAIGISAMMHGYLVFDSSEHLLTPFRTWRNTITERAAKELTKEFGFNIPQRWNIAHLYEAVLNKEDHVKDVDFLTTLVGYVHWKLTGQRVLGVGDASGVFPIDSDTNRYDAHMVEQFDKLVAQCGIGWKLSDILPKVLTAGEAAGTLTEEGARLLDPSGMLQAGIPLCPPEGDAGTGMVATNSIAPRTGNVSAGTSVFAMIVLEKQLSKVYPEIDMVTTPTGKPVAMVHCNSCTSDIDAWIRLIDEALLLMGTKVKKSVLYDELLSHALTGDADCGGLLSFNYYSGEPITGLVEGRPLFVRTPNASFTLANFMRTHLYAALGTLKLGMNILFEKENVTVDKLLGHGGFFKTKHVGQRMMAAAIGVPVAVMETAGEGGAWGIALLAAYTVNKSQGETLEEYLERHVFALSQSECAEPNPSDVMGFTAFMETYTRGIIIEQAAVAALGNSTKKVIEEGMYETV